MEKENHLTIISIDFPTYDSCFLSPVLKYLNYFGYFNAYLIEYML